MGRPAGALVLALVATCLVAGAEAKQVEVLANGETVAVQNSTEVETAALVEAGSGAKWSIKLPSCPQDLEICCSFFQTWDWGSWDECGEEILYVGKQLIKKAMELLDYLTDAEKLSKFVMNSPVTRKFWQLWNWGKKVVKAFKEAFENVVEGLVKVIMAMVRLVIGMFKIPGCWKLNSHQHAFMAFGGGFKGTDCGAMSSLKKIDVWGFMKNLAGCFVNTSPMPNGDAIKLPTPFLRVKEGPFCVYHIPPILRQLVDGVLQIAKAIVLLVVDIVALGLELIDIVAGALIKGTPLEPLVKSGDKLRKAANQLLSGKAPDGLPCPKASGLVKNKHGICLDASQRSTHGGKVHMWGCNAGNYNQQWTYNPSSGLIKNKHGICLDASQRGSNGGKVHMWGCNAGNYNQQWVYTASTHQIKAKHGICLDASQRNSHGGKVHMWSCNTGNYNQQWTPSFFPGSSLIQEEEEQQDEVVESKSMFKALFTREMEQLEQSVHSGNAVDASILDTVKESHNAERIARYMLAQHQSTNGDMWERLLPNSTSSTESSEEDEELMQKWVTSMAMSMNVESMLESTMASALAEEGSSASNSDKLGYFFKIGGSVTCKMEYAKFVFLHPLLLLSAFLIPILDPSLSGGASLAFSIGRTANTKGGCFSIGVSMGFAIGAAGTFDLFKLWTSWSEVLESAANKMLPDPSTIKLCDNWGKSMFAVVFAPVNLLGAPCAPLDAAGGKITGVFGGGVQSNAWGFGIALPLVVKSLAQIIGLPFDKTPGDLVSLSVGWSDFKSVKDAWFFGIGINPFPVLPDPTTKKPPAPPSPLVVSFTLGASWTWFLGIPCGVDVSRSFMATNVRSSVRARMESSCDAKAAEASCKAAALGSAAGFAKCVQESVSTRLSCGGAAALEPLGESAVVEKTLRLKFAGEGAGSIPVSLTAGWVSGLSSLQVESSSSASLLASGVRSKVVLAPTSEVQLRAVCLKWDATAAKNAFRAMSGEGQSARQRARQMAMAMEAKLHEDSGKMDASEQQSMASWVQFIKEYDASKPESLEQGVSVQMEAGSDMRTNVEHCFKVRVGGVRVELDTSVSGSTAEAFEAKEAQLHSFSLAKLDASVTESIAASSALEHAVGQMVASFEEASVASAEVQRAMRSAIATEIVGGVQSAMQKELCASLSSVVCPECGEQAAWKAQCSA